MNYIKKKIVSYWDQKHFLCYFLLPFSYVYILLVTLRRWLYKIGLIKTFHFPVPIIIVGNITVGGTGKTPLIIKLASTLKSQGYQPGIVSRGYGGKFKNTPVFVDPQSDPALIGDEPALIARALNLPLVVAPNRPAAISEIITKKKVDIILCDDGLQHYALARDIEIALLDEQKKFGNGFYLPAGPLRETPKRLQSVDFVLFNSANLDSDGHMKIKPGPIYNLKDPSLPHLVAKNLSRPIHAVAAIANPERFFNLLRRLDFKVIEHIFPDHYLFTPTDINYEEEIVIMTEKDAVKCGQFATKHHWVLPIQAELTKAFIEEFLEKVKAIHTCHPEQSEGSPSDA